MIRQGVCVQTKLIENMKIKYIVLFFITNLAFALWWKQTMIYLQLIAISKSHSSAIKREKLVTPSVTHEGNLVMEEYELYYKLRKIYKRWTLA